MFLLRQLFALLRHLVAPRVDVVLENVALRQQLAVLKSSVKRPKIDESDRVFWILLRRLWKEWSNSLVRPH